MAVNSLLVGCLLAVCWVTVTGYPLHASCNLTWSFTVPCGIVRRKIVNQMLEWNINAPCGNSEKSGYTITSEGRANVTGIHTTPVHKYVDDLTMNFSGTIISCFVKGFSSSQLYYAILDYGTNYCNLHNLVVGSGLANPTIYGFKEDTDDSICTQYSSANCDKY